MGINTLTAKIWDLLEFFHGNQQGVCLSFQLHHHRGAHPGTEHQQPLQQRHREGRGTPEHMPMSITWTVVSKEGRWDTTLASLICSLMRFRKQIPPHDYGLSFYSNAFLAPTLSLC